jgi:hypothetical protein
MRNLLIFQPNERPFSEEAIRRIVNTVSGFRDVRSHTPSGTLIEGVYAESDDWTIVRLNADQDVISLSGTTDAALRAALVLKQQLLMPLRIADTACLFDLPLSDFDNVAELRSAMNNAQLQ